VNRREAAGLIETLTDVDEFLRTPGTWALLEAFYRDRRGSTLPGCDASLLIDMAGLTLWSLQRQQQRRAEAAADAAAAREAARS
jgi:hypothetical protein